MCMPTVLVVCGPGEANRMHRAPLEPQITLITPHPGRASPIRSDLREPHGAVWAVRQMPYVVECHMPVACPLPLGATPTRPTRTRRATRIGCFACKTFGSSVLSYLSSPTACPKSLLKICSLATPLVTPAVASASFSS